MRFSLLMSILAAGATGLRAAQPPELAAALRYLAEQKSYSWEVINSDPGPVTQTFETRRGTATLVQQSSSPHMKGSVTADGERLVDRDWTDGMKMQVFVTADGRTVTKTPEGWMTDQDVLQAIADERTQGDEPSERYQWLRRADRPNLHRPDQELSRLLKGAGNDFEVSGDTYTISETIPVNSSDKSDGEDPGTGIKVTFVLHISGGVLRDYEVKIDVPQRRFRRSLQPAVHEDNTVILTYVPVTRLYVDDEAREKLAAKTKPLANEDK